MDDLVALAGDLLYEKKCLHDRLVRVEHLLLRTELGKSLLNQLGSSKAEIVYSDLEQASAAVDRVGSIAKTLVKEFSRSKLVPAVGYIKKIESELYRLAEEKQRQISCIIKVGCQGVDGAYFDEFLPILREYLSTLVEFGVETARERTARSKVPICQFLIEVHATEESTHLLLSWDGNGIEPPFNVQSGKLLSDLGGRVSFSGTLLKRSTLEYVMPITVGSIRGVSLDLNGRKVCIPFWAVTSIEQVEQSQASSGFGVNADLNLYEISDVRKLGRNVFRVRVAAGHGSVDIVSVVEQHSEEMFLKPLAPQLSANGRFLGVVASEQSSELRLILNPAYLVYRSERLPAELVGPEVGGLFGK